MKIIAELCQNHNGNFKVLKNMVKSASLNGATHVKIQHIYSKNLSKRNIFEAGYKLNNKFLSIKRPYKPEFDRLRKLEINKNQILRFIELCKEHRVIPLTTCFTREHVNEIKEMGFNEVKVASYDCGSFPMLKDIKKKFKFIYLSTGASYNIEIKEACRILKNNYSLLHCVTQYPTKIVNVNLSRIHFLKKYCKITGYSDHTNPDEDKLIASFAAIYFGAKVLERHFTILDKKKIKDGKVSINSGELAHIKEFSLMSKSQQLDKLNAMSFNQKLILGKSNAIMSEEEKLNRDYYRGRFVSFVNDKRGKFEVFNWENTPLVF